MKKISSLIIVTFLCALLVGCNSNSSSNNDVNNNENKNNEIVINLNNVEEKIEDLGISCEKEKTEASMVGAKDGFKLTSGEYNVEIYQFDKESDEYKTAEANQQLTMPSFNNYSFDAIVKNGYAYIIDSEFPQYDNVIDILEQLK